MKKIVFIVSTCLVLAFSLSSCYVEAEGGHHGWHHHHWHHHDHDEVIIR